MSPTEDDLLEDLQSADSVNKKQVEYAIGRLEQFATLEIIFIFVNGVTKKSMGWLSRR